jgi:hypothetical protein
MRSDQSLRRLGRASALADCRKADRPTFTIGQLSKLQILSIELLSGYGNGLVQVSVVHRFFGVASGHDEKLLTIKGNCDAQDIEN